MSATKHNRLQVLRIYLRSILLSLLGLVCLACLPDRPGGIPVVVGSADSPEQMVLGKITVLALRAAKYNVVDKTGLGSSQVVRAALGAGSIDVCWEYTGNTWLVYLGHDFPVADPLGVYRKVRDEDALNQISWLAPAPCQHVLTLVMREGDAQSFDIAELSDLARHMARQDPFLRLCTPQEYYEKSSGIRGLERVYGLRFVTEGVHLLPIQEGYEALQRGECDCALGFSGDSEIVAKGLRVLRDDRGFFQASNPAPAVRTPILRQLPSLERTLGEISASLTQEAMAELQRQMAKGDKPQVIARRFLAKKR